MRRGLLALAVVALAACCATAVAAPPPVVAPAYIVRGGPGAVVLAARAPDVARAPASITKLMTVLVALEHARLYDVVTVSPQAAGVGESSVNLRPGERLTVRDLAIAALVPSANDAATALAAYVGDGSIARFVAMMNAKATALGLTSTHFENPHGLDQRGSRLERARRDDAPHCGAPQSVHPHVVDPVDGDDRRRPQPDLDRRPDRHAAADRRQDGAHERRRLVAGRGGRRATASGSPRPCSGRRPRRSGTPISAVSLTWGLAQYHRVKAIDRRRVYGLAETGYGRPPVELVPAHRGRSHGAGGPAARRARRR